MKFRICNAPVGWIVDFLLLEEDGTAECKGVKVEACNVGMAVSYAEKIIEDKYPGRSYFIHDAGLAAEGNDMKHGQFFNDPIGWDKEELDALLRQMEKEPE